MTKDKTPKERLLNDLYKTKGARFNADKRLRAEHRVANYALMLLSVYMIALSVGEAYKIEFLQIQHSDFWSVILSVALLGIAALETGNNREKIAYKLHENAVHIGDLYRKLQLIGADDKDGLANITNKYAELLRDCEENHCDIDVRKHEFLNSWLPGRERLFSFGLWLILWVKHFALYYFAILAPLVFLLLQHDFCPSVSPVTPS